MRAQKHGQYQFFRLSEFDSPDAPGSGANMQVSTLQMLDKARALSGIPFVINSGFRTAAHNKRVGGARNSAHLRGFAVDIRCASDSAFNAVLFACIMAGFRRFGISDTYLHVDNDSSLTDGAMWTYDSKSTIQERRRLFAMGAFMMLDFFKKNNGL